MTRIALLTLACAGCLSSPNPAVFDAGPGDDDDDAGPDAAADGMPDAAAEVPVTPDPVEFVTGVAAGWAHSCARFDSGAVRCWGRNAEGQLGLADAEAIGDDEAPSIVDNLPLGILTDELALGREHTCARSPDGRVRCFGQGDSGQLGNGGTADVEPSTIMRSVMLPGAATAIAAGDYHSCAIVTGGALYCWGSNASGQVGVPGAAVYTEPTLVDVGADVDRVVAGSAHSCALLDGGAVRCWGSNASGQLGTPDVDAIGDDETPGSISVVLFGAPVASAIAAGAAHTCVIQGNGGDEVRCWGEGDSGRLGTDDTEDIGDDETPDNAAIALTGAGEIAAGGAFTCARTGGEVRCWGDGMDGVLGTGATTDLDQPPAGAIPLAGQATALAAGDRHVCALVSNGAVRCWGSNVDGRIGKTLVDALGDDETPDLYGATQVLRVVEVACGKQHTCARLENGKVRCWGDGARGKLGNEDTAVIGDDELPNVNGDIQLGAKATALALGTTHSCAIVTGGAVRCWGEGLVGQLGYGNPDDIGDNEPPMMAGNVNFGGTTSVIATGKGRTCVILEATGDVRCWGSNEYGAMGNQAVALIGETEQAIASPVTMLGGPAADLSAKDGHSCARMTDGSARCWGRVLYGRLGVPELTEDIGDTEHPSSIDAIDVGGTITQITTGADHSCALLTGGTLRCWGEGLLGRLGTNDEEDIGDTEDPSSLAVVQIGGTVTRIAGGGPFTCALLTGGTMRCFGYGAEGQAPYGTGFSVGDNEHPDAAGDVPLGAPATGLCAGDQHGCAVLDSGALRCWGGGEFGAHGYGTLENLGDNETPDEYGDVQLF